jgi:hypothetical protein
LREALLRVIGEPSLRAELRERGPLRARQYSWDTSGLMMTELLAEAAR